mgnify:FL=1
MNPRNLVLITAATLCVSGMSITANAQDDDARHVFAVSTHQWPFENLEEIFALMEEPKELVEQNEHILSRKVLTHEWAGDFSVMFIIEYASLADIDKAGERRNELFEAKFPDEEEREARNDKFAALTGSAMHVDYLLRGNPSLDK